MLTDDEAEAFLMQDLSDLDFSQFKRMHFEFEKEVELTFNVPQSVFDAIEDKAKEKGIPYTRYIRMLMEQDVARR